MTRSGCGAVIAIVLLGCSRDSPLESIRPVNLFNDGAAERILERPSFDTLWTYGKRDSVLASALQIDAFPNGDAAILDVVDQRVHRIGPDGLVWSWGRRGAGPREVENVRAMTVDDEGEIVLADSKNRRLVWLSSAGEWLREAQLSLPNARGWASATVSGILALENGRYLLTREGGHSQWVVLTGKGELERIVPPSWSGFQHMHPLQTHGRVAKGSLGAWVFGFAVGNGFFVFAEPGSPRSYPYVEHVDFPTVVTSRLPSGGVRIGYENRPVRAIQDMDIRDNTLMTLVRNWMLDRYDLATGDYISTIVLPGPTTGVATYDDVLLVIDAAGMFPAITALQEKER